MKETDKEAINRRIRKVNEQANWGIFLGFFSIICIFVLVFLVSLDDVFLQNDYDVVCPEEPEREHIEFEGFAIHDFPLNYNPICVCENCELEDYSLLGKKTLYTRGDWAICIIEKPQQCKIYSKEK